MQLEKKRLTAKVAKKVFDALKDKGCINPRLELLITRDEYGGVSYTLQDKETKAWMEGDLKTLLIQAILLSHPNS